MQVLWHEALEGNCPITVDEFFYCYKSSEIKKSADFYQFSSRGSYYSLIKSRSLSDKLWKKEFFIIFGNWARNPADVGNAPFPPFRFPLNSFCKYLFHRLGNGPNQLNPNGWRTIVAMQVLWHEALEGNCPITVDKFLYYYKSSEIKKSTGFYQFSSRGSYYSLIKSRSSSDKLWKKEFFIIFRNWAGNPADVGNAPFPPFTSPLGRLCPNRMFPFYFILFLFTYFLSFKCLTFFLW